MPSFWAFWSQAQGKERSIQIRLFRELVVAPHPEAYAAEVIGLDPSDPDALDHRLARYLDFIRPHIERMRTVSESIPRTLDAAVAAFLHAFPDFSLAETIYVMPSLGGFDGGTRTIGGREVLAFGPDVIALAHPQGSSLLPFFEHELFHVYHHGLHPSRPSAIGWSLWEEGLATYVSKALNPGASDVEVELSDELVTRAQKLLPQLAHELRQDLDDTSEATYRQFFFADGPRKDIPARTGYYVGMLVAARLAETRSLAALARLDGPELRLAIDAALAEMERRAIVPGSP